MPSGPRLGPAASTAGTGCARSAYSGGLRTPRVRPAFACPGHSASASSRRSRGGSLTGCSARYVK